MIKDQETIRVLTKLSEECGEVIQQVSKYIEHGPDSYHPDDPESTNTTLLSKEIGDIMAVVDLMGFIVCYPTIRKQREYKRKKLTEMGYANAVPDSPEE